MATTKRHDVKDLALAPEGVARIEWADWQMPVLAAIRERFAAEKPLDGHPHVSLPARDDRDRQPRCGPSRPAARISSSCASNPLSTQDDVAAALVEDYGIAVFAIKGEDNDTYYRHIEAAVDHQPQLTMDDGADVDRRSPPASGATQLGDGRSAATEETTTGVIRLRAMERTACSASRSIAVNDAKTKHFFDNRYGTGQSHDRRRHPRHEHPARRPQARRRRLRLVRRAASPCGPRGWART